MKKYKLIIFDFDGTLVDTASDIARHANAVLREYGIGAYPVERVKRAVGRGVHELLKDLGIPAKGKELDRAVASFKERYTRESVVETKVYPGVTDSLGGPLKEFEKAIVTNKPYDLTVKILRELSLEEYFKTVIGLGMEYPAKPDPVSVKFVMSKFETLPAETLFIGDSAVDAETSLNAGIDFGWVSYGYDGLNGHRATIVFSSPYEWGLLKPAAGCAHK